MAIDPFSVEKKPKPAKFTFYTPSPDRPNKADRFLGANSKRSIVGRMRMISAQAIMEEKPKTEICRYPENEYREYRRKHRSGQRYYS